MICLDYVITHQDKKLKQRLICSDCSVFIEIGGKELVFFQDKKQVFEINKTDKVLKKIDLDPVKKQMDMVRTKLGKMLPEDEKEGQFYLNYPARKISFKNSESEISFCAEVILLTLQGIRETAYSSYIDFESDSQFFQIKRRPDEIVANNATTIYYPNGSFQCQSVELSSVKNTETDNNRDLSEYKVIQ
ncbi:MAG: hypothetical protein FWF54_08445 [Candidatus Azobacteroides sp.]|nr:hypothetical protein [Candidatus Azobacteroides sp.]